VDSAGRYEQRLRGPVPVVWHRDQAALASPVHDEERDRLEGEERGRG